MKHYRIPVILLVVLLQLIPLQAQQVSVSIIVRVAPSISEKTYSQSIAAIVARQSATLVSNNRIATVKNLSLQAADARLDRYRVLSIRTSNPDSLLRALRTTTFLEAAFLNHRYKIDGVPNDSLFDQQWNLKTIQASEAWSITSGDSAIRVGVIDTGIDFLHPDLVSNIRVNALEDINHNGRFDPWLSTTSVNGVKGDLDGLDQDGNGFPDDVIGYDFVDQSVQNTGDWNVRDPIPDDQFSGSGTRGHGTEVTGVIGAIRNNEIGIAGVAPGVSIVALRAFDATGNAEDDDIAAAIIYAADNRVQVLNLSFGDYFDSPLLHDAIRYAYSKGVVIVASSGNNTVPDPHYPSAYPEVIAVGASNVNDKIASFSGYGSHLGLVAPGEPILSTAPNGNYVSVNGTSFSAPHVAATAALLKSIHPSWTPEEIRAALLLTTDNCADQKEAWDVVHGSGRLNARRALESVGASSVSIESPGYNTGYSRDTVLTVTGSVSTPLLQSWYLSVGSGELPSRWDTLGPIQYSGMHHDKLGELNIGSTYPDGVYILRLTLLTTNGKRIERRVRIIIERNTPVIQAVSVDNCWRLNERAILIQATTNVPTIMSAYVRRTGTSDQYRSIELEPEFSGMTNQHFLVLTSRDLIREVDYDMYMEVRNAAGLVSRYGSPQQPNVIKRERDVVRTDGFALKKYQLPFGFALNQTFDVYNNGKQCILLNRFTSGGYDSLMIYEFNNGSFIPKDSTGNWVPRGFGDVDGNGLMNVLGQAGRGGILFEQATKGGNPFARISFVDTLSKNFYASALYDFDKDGRSEIIAHSSNDRDSSGRLVPRSGYYYIISQKGSTYDTVSILNNPTPRAPDKSISELTSAETVIDDLDGNGNPDILFGDNDGDVVMYERAADGTFKLRWSDTTAGIEANRMLATADIDGDGNKEIVVAYRTDPSKSENNDYATPYWTVRLYALNAQNQYQLSWSDRIVFTRPSESFRTGISAGDLNGIRGDEVVIVVSPSMYVFTWDSTLKRPVSLWWQSGIVSNKPIIQDFDSDGRNELGVGDGTTITFWQDTSDYRVEYPNGFQATSVNDSTVELEWNPVEGATYYTIYRALYKPGNTTQTFDSVAIATATMLTDTGFREPSGRLLNNSIYLYTITTRISDLESPIAPIRSVFMHQPAVISQAVPISSRAIRVQLSQPVSDELYRSTVFRVQKINSGEEVLVSSVLSGDQRSLVIVLAHDVYDDSLTLRITPSFLDYYRSPADTSQVTRIRMPGFDSLGSTFIATKAYKYDDHTIAVEFNGKPMPFSLSSVANFTIHPAVIPISVVGDPSDSERVLVKLPEDYLFGALGNAYTVTITNVVSTTGLQLNDGAGSVVGFVLNANDLASVFAYPQPFSLSKDIELVFAHLTQRATISIYTLEGSLLRTVKATEGNGGAHWDGRDDKGNLVTAGRYLFRVTGVSADGSAMDSGFRKLAILP